MVNAVHGSLDPASSEREIELLFPHILNGAEDAEEQLDRDLAGQPEDNREYLQKYVCPTLLKGLTEMYETRPRSPVLWLAEWLADNNPYRN